MTQYFYIKLWILNFLGFHRLPISIKYNDLEYDLLIANLKSDWLFTYTRFIAEENETDMRQEDLVVIQNSSKRKCYFEMLDYLWRNKKCLTID